ncbi:MAG: transcriptional repressor LexA [Cellulosilyticaceae bacterium]
MEHTLTEKQEQILACIKQGLKDRGYPPSVREICLAVGLRSTSTVHAHLNKLEEKGFIRRDPTKPRAIEVFDEEANWLADHVTPVPVVGRVTAGEPILASHNIEDYFPLPTHMTRNKDVYMLKVKGESMINAGILDGDHIVVKEQSYANNGEIIVALIDDAATVKRFYKEANRIRLQPENDAMDPIYAKEVTILGKVIGLFREF